MKIAIPTRDNKVDEHFGHCEYYSILTLSNEMNILEETQFEAPKGCGCKSDIASVLKEMGVDTMLAGNMGQGAVNKISETGIKVIRGCKGSIKEVVSAFLNNQISDSGLVCDHHSGDHEEEGHQCNH
jgi:predicted Fe-Mo cluster-binding NifX family protein